MSKEEGSASEQVAPCVVRRFRQGAGSTAADVLAVERALTLRVVADGEETLLTTTMRTPGADRELAAGFLLAERVVHAREDLVEVRQREPDAVVAVLGRAASGRVAAAARRFVTSSACGVCGRDDVTTLLPPPEVGTGTSRVPATLAAETIQRLPLLLRESQAAFAQTGGLHAAGLFDLGGDLLSVREDVGRHNAVDKVIGAEVLAGRLTLLDHLLVVSGRASFELVQKAAVARIPCLLAVGAPSSLAVEVARDNDMTLVGFVRPDGFNLYAHGTRVRVAGLD